MAILIWNGLVSSDITNPDNWTDQATQLPPPLMPGVSDTVYIGDSINPHLIGTTLAVENMYIFGDSASYFMPPGVPNPGVQTPTLIDIMTIQCSGVFSVGCGTEGTTLQNEGTGFADPGLVSNGVPQMIMADTMWINGGTWTSLFHYSTSLWLGDGATGIDPILTTAEFYYSPASTMTSKLWITKDNLACGKFAMNNSTGGTCTLQLDLTSAPYLGSRTTNFQSFYPKVVDFQSTADPVNLSWNGTPGTYTDMFFGAIDGGYSSLLPTSVNNPTQEWRFLLTGTWANIFLHATENATPNLSGENKLDAAIINPLDGVTGWGQLRTGNSSWLVGAEIPWQTGGAVLDTTLTLILLGATLQENGGPYRTCLYTCDDATSSFTATSVEINQTLGSGGWGTPINIGGVSSTTQVGPNNLSLGGLVDFIGTTDVLSTIHIQNGATVTNSGGFDITVRGTTSVAPGAINSMGDWSAMAIKVAPAVGGQTAFIGYHGQGGTATGTTGEYILVGSGTATPNSFLMENTAGLSPNMVIKKLTFGGGNTSLTFNHSLGEVKITDTLTVPSGMSANTGSIDWSNCAKLYMEGTTTFQILGDVNGWTNIPHLQFMTGGTHTFVAPDNPLETSSATANYVNIGYADGTATVNYTSGRFKSFSLAGTSTIVPAQPLRLNPTNGTTTFISNAGTTLNAVQIEVDMRNLGNADTCKVASLSTDPHGVLRAAFKDANWSVLQVENMKLSTIEVFDVAQGSLGGFIVEHLGDNTVITQPLRVDHGQDSTIQHKFTGNLKCLQAIDFATNGGIDTFNFVGGTLECRNSGDTAYTNLSLNTGEIMFDNSVTMAAASIKCLRFEMLAGTINWQYGGPGAHVETAIEIYGDHANPLVQADYVVWIDGATMTNPPSSWPSGRSVSAYFDFKSTDAAQYNAVKQAMTGGDGYTGLGMKGGTGKLVLEGTGHELFGRFLHSATETTFNGNLQHTGPGGGTYELYNVRGTIGASSVAPRLTSKVLNDGAYIGTTDIADCHPHTIHMIVGGGGTGTLAHSTAQDTTYTVVDDAVGWGIETGANWTATQTFVQGMDLKVVNGDITYAGTGTVEADGDPTLYLLGAKSGSPTNLNITVTSNWQIIGSAPVYTAVQIGDGTYNTTVADYSWSNVVAAPARSYPSHLNIAAGCTARQGIATTGAGYVTGSGTYDWNNTGSPPIGNLIFEVTRHDNTNPWHNNLTMANGHFLEPVYSTTLRFTPDLDPGTYSNACELPTTLTCNVEIGLQSAGTWSTSAAYVIEDTNTTINGNFVVDYGDAAHGVLKGATIGLASGASSAKLTVDGVNEDDILEVKRTGHILSSIDLDVKEAGLTIDTGGAVNADTVRFDHVNTDAYNIFTNTLNGALSGTSMYMLGKGKSTTYLIWVNGTAEYTNIYVGRDGSTNSNIRLQDTGMLGARNGTAFSVQNLTLGNDSIVSFEAGHSYWIWSGSGDIIDWNDQAVNPESGMVGPVYGTPTLGLIVVDGPHTLTHSVQNANQGIIADLLYLNNGATFTTSGSNANTHLYLKGRSCADVFGTGATDNKDAGIGYSESWTNPSLHCYDSNFYWPSNNGRYGTQSILVLGSPSGEGGGDAVGAAAIYGTSNFVLGDTSTDVTTTWMYLNGRGVYLGKDNAKAANTTTIKNCNMYSSLGVDTVHMFRISNYNGTTKTGATNSTVELRNCHVGTINDGGCGFLHFAMCTYFEHNIENNEVVGNFPSAVTGTIVLGGLPSLTSTIHENRIEVTGETAHILFGSSILWPPGYPSYLRHNAFVGNNMTAGIGVLMPVTTFTDTTRNFIAVPSVVTPITTSTSSNDMHICGWSLPLSNTRFGFSVRGGSGVAISEWTNMTNLSQTLLSGTLDCHRTTVAFHPPLWKTSTGASPAITVQSGDKSYRKGKGADTQITSIHLPAGSSSVKFTWDEWDEANPITVVVVKHNSSGSTSGGVTNGENVDLSGCCSVQVVVSFGNEEAGFANMKLVETVSGLTLFSDSQPLKFITQMDSIQQNETGPGTDYFGIASTNSASNRATQSHQYNDPQKQMVTGELIPSRGTTPGSAATYRMALCAQDEDNRYEYVVSYSVGNWSHQIIKIQNGVETVLTGPTTFVPNFAASVTYMEASYDIHTGQVKGYFDDSGTLTATDSTFTNGYYGLSGYGNNSTSTQFDRVWVREGSTTNTLIYRNTALTFMPSSGYVLGASTEYVDLRHLTVNSNLSAVFSNINNGDWNPVIEDVTWADTRMDEDIESFVQLIGVTLEVDQDITLSGNGKLWLTGCNISGKNDTKWRIRTEGISYENEPPLKIEGCLLSGLNYSVRPIGNAPYETLLLDDASHNTSVIRMQTDKDIDVQRHRIVGLNFDRMTDNGFESRLSTVTCVCVNDAYIMGMMEKLWMDRTLIEFISPYCYTYRGKITQFNQRILNPQISAAQFVIEIEEWRED